MKVIKMLKNDPITGVEYGTVDVPGTEVSDTEKHAARAYNNAKKLSDVRRKIASRTRNK